MNFLGKLFEWSSKKEISEIKIPSSEPFVMSSDHPMRKKAMIEKIESNHNFNEKEKSSEHSNPKSHSFFDFIFHPFKFFSTSKEESKRSVEEEMKRTKEKSNRGMKQITEENLKAKSNKLSIFQQINFKDFESFKPKENSNYKHKEPFKPIEKSNFEYQNKETSKTDELIKLSDHSNAKSYKFNHFTLNSSKEANKKTVEELPWKPKYSLASDQKREMKTTKDSQSFRSIEKSNFEYQNKETSKNDEKIKSSEHSNAKSYKFNHFIFNTSKELNEKSVKESFLKPENSLISDQKRETKKSTENSKSCN